MSNKPKGIVIISVVKKPVVQPKPVLVFIKKPDIPPPKTVKKFDEKTRMCDKRKCKYWKQCKKTGKNCRDHKNQFYHPCKYGSSCHDIGNFTHRNRFVHPCRNGKNCVEKNPNHFVCFYH